MRINLLYNKIVADTATEAFIESFNKIALPKLSSEFSEVEEVIIYEDYLSDGLTIGSVFYCPLTLVSGGMASRAFASWRVDAKKFKDAVPYSYVGKEPLNIDISATAPAEIEKKIEGRVPFLSDNSIKLTVSANTPTKTFLSGKYSQAFIDVMRNQLTYAIEREFDISGAAESSLEFSFVFSPESFMEHVLDNVSYRRVLLSAKSCAPRDLFIKWARLDGKGTYTVSNHVKPTDILFELCDEVPEKFREREYRYLISAEGMTAYKNAMSRKNFMEWRELVKRVIKRGEVMQKNFDELSTEPLKEIVSEPLKLPEDKSEDAFDSEISLKLQSVLENYNIETEPSPEPSEEDINPDITELLRSLLEGNEGENEDTGEDFSKENETPDDTVPPFDIDEGETSEGENDVFTEVEPAEEAEEAEEEEESFAELDVTLEANDDAEEFSFGGTSFDSFSSCSSSSDEYEEILKEKECEILSLKEEKEALSTRISELENKNAELRALLTDCEKAVEDAKREQRKLVENLDAAKRREERERDRIAEAAKIAVAERYKEEAPVALDEDESEKLRKEAEAFELERAAREREEAERIEAARLEREREAAKVIEEKPSPVRYVSKVADISFRHPVDPNITKRIQEIIVTTVKYFGKENVYMKIKATIPDSYMVRLEFQKIPENESALLSDIIRVLGHSKLGIAKVLLD